MRSAGRFPSRGCIPAVVTGQRGAETSKGNARGEAGVGPAMLTPAGKTGGHGGRVNSPAPFQTGVEPACPAGEGAGLSFQSCRGFQFQKNGKPGQPGAGIFGHQVPEKRGDWVPGKRVEISVKTGQVEADVYDSPSLSRKCRGFVTR